MFIEEKLSPDSGEIGVEIDAEVEESREEKKVSECQKCQKCQKC